MPGDVQRNAVPLEWTTSPKKLEWIVNHDDCMTSDVPANALPLRRHDNGWIKHTYIERHTTSRKPASFQRKNRAERSARHRKYRSDGKHNYAIQLSSRSSLIVWCRVSEDNKQKQNSCRCIHVLSIERIRLLFWQSGRINFTRTKCNLLVQQTVSKIHRWFWSENGLANRSALADAPGQYQTRKSAPAIHSTLSKCGNCFCCSIFRFFNKPKQTNLIR